MSVSATDADDPTTDNAFLSYSIIGQESVPAGAVTKVMFGINNQTGAIYTRDVGLDREVRVQLQTAADLHTVARRTKVSCVLSQVVKSFRLRLQIADMGGMGLTGEGLAIVHVADINNNAPQFSPASVSLVYKACIKNSFQSSCDSTLNVVLRLRWLAPAVQLHNSGEQDWR